jgi:hypothetical protein
VPTNYVESTELLILILKDAFLTTPELDVVSHHRAAPLPLWALKLPVNIAV